MTALAQWILSRVPGHPGIGLHPLKGSTWCPTMLVLLGLQP